MDVPAILHLFDFLVHIGKLNERFRFDETQIKASVSKGLSSPTLHTELRFTYKLVHMTNKKEALQT